MILYVVLVIFLIVSIWGMAATNKVTHQTGYGSGVHILIISALYGTTWGPALYLGQIV